MGWCNQSIRMGVVFQSKVEIRERSKDDSLGESSKSSDRDNDKSGDTIVTEVLTQSTSEDVNIDALIQAIGQHNVPFVSQEKDSLVVNSARSFDRSFNNSITSVMEHGLNISNSFENADVCQVCPSNSGETESRAVEILRNIDENGTLLQVADQSTLKSSSFEDVIHDVNEENTDEMSLGDKLEGFCEYVNNMHVLEEQSEENIIHIEVPKYEITREERKRKKRERLQELMRQKEEERLKLEMRERKDRKDKEMLERLGLTTVGRSKPCSPRPISPTPGKSNDPETGTEEIKADKVEIENVEAENIDVESTKVPEEDSEALSSLSQDETQNFDEDALSVESESNLARAPKETRLRNIRERFRQIVWTKILKKPGLYDYRISPSIARVIKEVKRKKLSALRGNEPTPLPTNIGQFSIKKFDRQNGKYGSLTEEQREVLCIPPEERSEYHLSIVLDVLQRHGNFKKYSLSIKKDMSKIIMYERFERDRVVCRQGNVATKLYFIITGSCLVNVKSSDGTERTVNTLEAGENFGENALNKVRQIYPLSAS